jgi:hypothetical protein
VDGGRWRERINSTFNPEAIFYAGQVEENRQEPTGVYITELRSLYPVSYVGTPPVLLGRLEAKSFIPGGVRIYPSCRLERSGKRYDYEGTPKLDPPGPLDVNLKLISDVTCTFDGATNLSPGTYYGVLGASFDYETWAYVTNTFVSRSLIEQYYRQGKDINYELDIPQATETIFTNGPVQIGVSASQQPIDINPEARDGRFIQQRFGFTVASRWSQGELKQVYRVNVLVPKPFEIRNCLPAYKERREEGTFYNYTFEGWQNKDERNDYRTVNCELALPGKEAARKVLAFGDKTPATFVVLARYQYEIEKKVPVKVQP